MPLGNRAEDFGVVLRALDDGSALPDQAAYDALKQSLPGDFAGAFHERFYRERDAFARQDPSGWQALLGPYPAFVELLRRKAAERGCPRLAIATAKDRPAVDRLLENYGLRDLFPPEWVCDKDMGPSKRAHLSALQERSGARFDEITFVDDKVNHLQDVEGLGVRPVLAGWGYNDEREAKLARSLGFAVCTLETAEALLFGASG